MPFGDTDTPAFGRADAPAFDPVSALDDLLPAVIEVESGGKADAVSPKGAVGLMQVMPGTARDPGFGLDPTPTGKLVDPKTNLRAGAAYLGKMLERYGDQNKAIAAYNAGPGRVDRAVAERGDDYLSVLPKETREYVRKVGEARQKKAPAFGEMDQPAFGAQDKPAFQEEPAGGRVGPPESMPRTGPSDESTVDVVAQNILEFGKGIPSGAVSLTGAGIAGASAAQARKDVAMQRSVADLSGRLRAAGELEDDDLRALLRDINRSPVPAEVRSEFLGVIDRARRGEPVDYEPSEAVRRILAPLPAFEDRPGARIGRGVTEYGRGILPAAPGYEESPGRLLGEGIGSVAAGVAMSWLTGPAGAAALFAFAGSGEAVERAIEAGATDDQIIEAARKGLIPGLTDSVPVEILLGRIPVGGRFFKVPAALLGRVLRRIERIGLQGLTEGLQEGGQEFLQNLIAKEVYDPDQDLGEGIVPSAGVGAGVGALAETGRQILKGFAGRRRGTGGPAESPAPRQEPYLGAGPPAAPAGQPEPIQGPGGVPPGAAPAGAIIGEEFGTEDAAAFPQEAPTGPGTAEAISVDEQAILNVTGRRQPYSALSEEEKVRATEESRRLAEEPGPTGAPPTEAAAERPGPDYQPFFGEQGNQIGWYNPQTGHAVALGRGEAAPAETVIGATPEEGIEPQPPRTREDLARDLEDERTAEEIAAEAAWNAADREAAARWEPTREWQTVPKGAVLPPGLEIRMDMETGEQMARVPPQEGSPEATPAPVPQPTLEPSPAPGPAPNIHTATYGNRGQQHAILERARGRLRDRFGNRIGIRREGRQWTMRLRDGTPEENAAVAEEVNRQTQVTVNRAEAGRKRGGPVRKGPMGLAEAIARDGGITDPGGELRAADLQRWHVGKPGMPRLVVTAPGQQGALIAGMRGASTRSPDYRLEWAVERGYLPEGATVSDLYEALRENRMTPEGADSEQARREAEETEDRNEQARWEVQDTATDMGEALTDGEADEVVRLMVSQEMDAESAVGEYIERRAIQDAERLAEETGNAQYEDIPFEEAGPARAREPVGARGGRPAGEHPTQEAGPAVGAAPQGTGRPREAEGGQDRAPDEGGRSPEGAQEGVARPLYVNRPVANAADIIAWAASQGFKITLPADDMHVTVAFSREPVVWDAAGEGSAIERVEGGARTVEKLGDEGGVVLRFEAKALTERWQAYRDAGASWDFPGYKPHITITYDAGDVDLAKVAPYSGPIILAGESREDLDTDATSKVKEVAVPKPATEQTDQGEQTVLPGAERISEREQVGRRMGEPLRSEAEQRGLEGAPLFDPEARPGAQRDLVEDAGRGSEPAKAETRGRAQRPRRRARKPDQIDRLENYFRPGRIVFSSYWKAYDKVLSFNREEGIGGWSVTVQEVDKDGAPTGPPRDHSTMPDERELGAWERENPIGREDAPASPGGEEGPAFALRRTTGRTINIQGVDLPMNDDGTVALYHGTTQQGAEEIRKTGRLKADAEPDVYLTTDPSGGGYGDTVLPIRVNPARLVLDDQFPSGRADFRINVGESGGSINVEIAEEGPAFARRARSPETTTQESTDAWPGIRAELRVELDRLGLRRVGLALPPSIHGGKADAMYLRRVISVALDAADKLGALHHEVIHAMRRLNMITPKEWRALEIQARKSWIKEHRIRERWADQNLTEEQIVEEAVAEGFRSHMRGPRRVGGTVGRVFDAIRRALEAIRNAFRGAGFNTWESVFGRIERGEVGLRAARAERGIGGEMEPAFAMREGERGSVPSVPRPDDPDTPANRQRAMQGFIARGEPLDRVLRIPFDWFGGINEKGEWKPGLKMYDRAAKAIVGKKFNPEGRFAWLNGPMEAARAGLIDRYGLAPEYVKRERRVDLEKREIAQKGVEILKTIKEQKIGPEEARVLQAILTGEEIPSAEWEKLSGPVRQAIDELGAEAVSLGLVSPESYERNRGTYLHRVYMKDEGDQPTLSRWFSNFMGNKRKRIQGDALKGRGMFQEVENARLMRDMQEFAEAKRGLPVKGEKFRILDQIPDQGEFENVAPAAPKVERRVYWPADKPVPERFKGMTDRGVWEVRAAGKNKVTLWRDYTKAERERMGEILDARYTIGKTFMLMANDLATGRFYRDIALNQEWTRGDIPNQKWVNAAEFRRLWNDQTVEWVKVPDTDIPNTGGKKRWGALAGKYVRPEIWRDLNEIDIMARPNFWTQILTQWKLNKTARSPVVHMNNIMSNVMFMDLADVRMQDLVRGLHAYVGETADFIEAKENGAFGADIISQEMKRNVFGPILNDLQREMAGGRNPAMAKFGLMGRIVTAIWDAGKAADRKMIDMYRIEDEVFRMATYMRRRSLGEEVEDSALQARQQFLDYDIRAPWVNKARRTVLPFIAYTYRAVPVIAQSLSLRPWKLAKYFLIAQAANYLAYMMEPGDEDKERRSIRDEERGYTWVGTPRMLRMPYRDAHGNPVFLDVRRWIPAGDIFDINQGHSAISLPAPLGMGGPIMLAMELALSRSAFTGDDIVNELTDTPMERVGKTGDFLWKSWMPSAAWVPWSWYWNKIGLAISDAVDPQGRQYPVPEAVASSFGVKLKPQDVEQNLEWRAYEFDKQRRALNAESRRLDRLRQRRIISEGAWEEGVRSIEGKLDRIDERERQTFKD
jgi:hypothetical protein